jgi:hypothetical protein
MIGLEKAAILMDVALAALRTQADYAAVTMGVPEARRAQEQRHGLPIEFAFDEGSRLRRAAARGP